MVTPVLRPPLPVLLRQGDGHLDGSESQPAAEGIRGQEATETRETATQVGALSCQATHTRPLCGQDSRNILKTPEINLSLLDYLHVATQVSFLHA